MIGEGNNFVRTMVSLAERGVSPSVVSDQIGRLTFTTELSRATAHLLSTKAAPGTYNVSNGGEAMSWAEIAQAVFERSGRAAGDVTPVITDDYYAGKTGIAPRPLQSAMSLAKIRSTGFEPEDAMAALDRYLGSERP